MSILANIAAFDGQATPIAHTFYPVSNAGNVFSYRENHSGLPIYGNGTFVLDGSKTRQKSGVNLVKMSLDIPVLETATGANSSGYTAAPKVAYSVRAVVSFYLPDRSTAAQRKDLRTILSNALGSDVQIIDSVDDLLLPV